MGSLDMPENQLHDHMRKVRAEVLADYERIRKRVREDPGTAGDEGEETWAEVLRAWLPATYQVETKGRVMFVDGWSSPQVDVVVLKPWYPRGLARRKHFLAAGVAAAFECKLTLTAGHIPAALRTAALLRQHEGERHGTPYKELHGKIVYGLLAHSHDWIRPGSQPVDNITRALIEKGVEETKHPREMLNMLCVANLGTWFSHVSYSHDYVGQVLASFGSFDDLPPHFKAKTVMASYMRETGADNPIAAVLSHLLACLAWSDPSIRDMADYFERAGMRKAASGEGRVWPREEVLTDRVIARLSDHSPAGFWNEWASHF